MILYATFQQSYFDFFFIKDTKNKSALKSTYYNLEFEILQSILCQNEWISQLIYVNGRSHMQKIISFYHNF